MKTFYSITGRVVPTGRVGLTSSLQVSTVSFYVLLLLLIIVLPVIGKAQLQPGNPAKFGIDGDLMSDERSNGTFSSAGSHDWFQKAGGTGFGIFSVEGASSIKSQIAAGTNYTFSRKMQYPMYSEQDGLLFLDATYMRDYLGLGTSTANSDKTVFVSGTTGGSTNNQSFQNPETWTTIPGGGTVPSKSDLIDNYIHMRRNGTSTVVGNASDLILTIGATTLSTSGNHYIDFELYKTALAYDPATGVFSGAGPAATGGRSAWEFNADGSVKTFGDITFSFSFSSTTVDEIAIYIWVPYTVYNTVNPQKFDFAKGGFNGNSVNSGYGYAKIVPDPGASFDAWGTVNSVNTPGPVWGTSSKELGTTGTNFYSDYYSPGQFAEAAINLTALGIDPAITSDMGKCTPPYRRVMVQSRSSIAFSSALQDFAGPFEFLDAPVALAEIAPVSTITCKNAQVVLQPATIVPGATYTWTTNDGNIVDGASAATATIDKGGSYMLEASLFDGCFPKKGYVTVQQDLYKPVATAITTGVLTGAVTSTVWLQGGDATASNYTTPFGGSQGLTWQWNGPGTFSAATQNAVTSTSGDYTLTVTEKRNDCSATATVKVSPPSVSAIILPVSLLSFTGSLEKEQALLKWSVASNELGSHFAVEKSTDGQHFAAIGYVFTSDKTGREDYQFRDVQKFADAYYRLAMSDKSGNAVYSKIISLRTNTTDQLRLMQNPVTTSVQFQVSISGEGEYTVAVYAMDGRMVQSSKVLFGNGFQTTIIPLNSAVRSGAYILEVRRGGERMSTLFIRK